MYVCLFIKTYRLLYGVFTHQAFIFSPLCRRFLLPKFAIAFTSYTLFLYHPFYTTSPQKTYYPLSFFNDNFLHTSFLLYLLPRRPQSQNSVPSCFRLWFHTVSYPNSLGSCHGAHFKGCFLLQPLILFGARGSLPTLT